MSNTNNFISHQSYAVAIEHILWKVFNCERFGLGGIVNSDYIDGNPYSAIACALAVYYPNNTDDNKKLIDKFLGDYCFYNNKSISEIGEKDIDKMIEKFRNILTKIKK